MQQKIREVACRIQELRELCGIGVAQMAAALQLPVESYERIESGAEDMSVGMLHQIAGELKVDLSLLLSGEAPRLKIFTVTRRGKGVSVERRSQYGYQSLAANFIDKKIEPFLVTAEPGAESDSLQLHSHPGQEFNYVLEGRLRIVIYGHDIVLEEGDSIFFDASHGHAMQALDGRPAHFLAVVS